MLEYQVGWTEAAGSKQKDHANCGSDVVCFGSGSGSASASGSSSSSSSGISSSGAVWRRSTPKGFKLDEELEVEIKVLSLAI